jgi:RHS repeat-associated protein
MTGITDRRGVRFSRYQYDYQGRLSSEYQGPYSAVPTDGINGLSVLNYGSFFRLTNSRGFTTDYWRAALNGYELPTSTQGKGCATCGPTGQFYQYFSNSYDLMSVTDNGQVTSYDNYGTTGNPELVTEAVGTPEQRATSYTYDSRFQDKIATTTEPSVYPGANKVTTYSYDDYGNTTAITISGYRPDGTPVSRTRTYTYNGPYRQLSAIDGPRTSVSDITTIDYYADDPVEGNNRARMKKVTAPLGVVFYDNITYTATGKQASYTTGSNLQVDFTYDAGNDRLQTQTLTDLSSSKSRTTRWTYTATGKVASITQADATPEATTLTFAYDDADRLTRIYDGFGNYMEFTLDTEGNVTDESIYDSADVLQKALNKTFDAYNRLDIATQANETRNRDFAPDGTLDQETDGKNVVTNYSYDALRRLTSITQDVGGTDPSSANALTQFDYDVQDNLTSVTDPNGGQTQYVYDDLGNRLSLSSPDTGTATYTHDEAGNTLSATDAKGQVFNYSYDALGRLQAVDAPGIADDITYAYDTCTNGAGRLCSVTNSTATVTYAYTTFGDISQVDQTINADQGYPQFQSQLSYTYDAAGRLQDVIYPSGAKITYTRDTAGNVYSVILNDGEKNLITGSTYYPFGSASTTTRGNGSVITGQRDTAYRLSMIGNMSYFYDVINYDANGNPNTFSSSEGAKSHGYDDLDRLDTSTGPYGSRDYDYDANGNRVQLDDGVTMGYSYTANSNRMTQVGTNTVQLDANGNMLSVGSRFYNYTAQNRLFEALDNTTLLATYAYNGLGERTGKYTPAGGARYMFDPDGKLIAEIDLQGSVSREYVYLNDELLALIELGSSVSTTLYVHNDHLGTPHMLTNDSGIAVWSAYYDPFGLAAVDEDVDGDTNTVTLNVRFPGQYYDGETGLHYNYFRYYDPETGRYITSDPIGLEGGLNTYGYVGANPLNYTDPSGLVLKGRNTPEAHLVDSVARGNVSEVKMLLQIEPLKTTFSKRLKQDVLEQCRANASKQKLGTLDVKDAERRIYESIVRGNSVESGKPSPNTTSGKIAEFFRAVSEVINHFK